MGKKYALDLNDPNVLDFVQKHGISAEELQLKNFQDFSEPGVLPEIQEVRFNYHQNNLAKLKIYYKAFLVNRGKTKEKPDEKTEIRMQTKKRSQKLLNSVTLRKLSPVTMSQTRLDSMEKSEDRVRKIKETLESKILQLKKSFELKKIKQIERLQTLEEEREEKNKKLIEKLKRISSLHEKVNKSYEIYQTKPEFRYIEADDEEESDENIQASLTNLQKKLEEAKKRSEQDLLAKVHKARKLRKNKSIDKKEQDEEEIGLKLKKLYEKVEKINEIKKIAEKKKRYREHVKREKDEFKKKQVMSRLLINENEIKKKIKETEKRLNKNLDWVLEEKLERMKSKAVQNEIGQLSVKTRINRINTKFVRLIKILYKNRLFSECQFKARRAEEFIEQRKVSSTKKLYQIIRKNISEEKKINKSLNEI